MIKVITSFNQRYYDLIGRDCVESFLKYWPEHMSITCYVEDFSLPENPRIVQVGFDALEADYFKFQAEPQWTQGEKKFSKKAYTVMHALNNTTSGWVVWLDADVVSIQDLPIDLWDQLLDSDKLSLYMGVTYFTDKAGNEGNWLVPETGVFAFNTEHPDFEQFRAEYCRRYNARDKSELRRYYDNDVLGAAVNVVPDAGHIDLCLWVSKALQDSAAAYCVRSVSNTLQSQTLKS
jgi:hypothetical protein